MRALGILAVILFLPVTTALADRIQLKTGDYVDVDAWWESGGTTGQAIPASSRGRVG